MYGMFFLIILLFKKQIEKKTVKIPKEHYTIAFHLCCFHPILVIFPNYQYNLEYDMFLENFIT